MDLSIFIKYYLDKDSDYQLSIDKIFLIKVQALFNTSQDMSRATKKVKNCNFQQLPKERNEGGGGPGISLFDCSENFQGILK